MSSASKSNPYRFFRKYFYKVHKNYNTYSTIIIRTCNSLYGSASKYFYKVHKNYNTYNTTIELVIAAMDVQNDRGDL